MLVGIWKNCSYGCEVFLTDEGKPAGMGGLVRDSIFHGGLVYKGNLIRVRVNDAVTEGNVNNAELTYC